MAPKAKRGHRQHGAGTVVVSRGDQIRQGVTCKEWQRTPMQLLQEYCQSKKRVKPRYAHARAADDRVRMRCILPDAKSTNKDLVFCPTQVFETAEEAKHCAALLALQHLEPSLPLERKLPDPYRELWLAMASTSRDASPSAVGSAGKSKEAAGAKAKSVRGKEVGVEASREQKTRTQGATTDEAKPSTKEESAQSGGKQAAAVKMDLWSAGDGGHVEEETKMQVKMPTELTADRKFASRAAYEQARLEKQQQRNDRTRSRENRERANPDKTVLMSAACRERIENVLKTLEAARSENRTENETTTSNKGNELSNAVDYKRIAKQLERLGFETKHAEEAMQACTPTDAPDSHDEYWTRVLDWLCLHLPEGALPKGFNPAGTQLDVIVPDRSMASASPLQAALVQRMMQRGYDRRDSVAFVDQYLQDHKDDVDTSIATPSKDVLLHVLKIAFSSLLQHFSIEQSSTSTSMAEEAVLESRQDELLALEAIYDDRVVIETLKNGVDQVITIQGSDMQLEVWIPKHSRYPCEFPLISANLTETQHQPQLLQAYATALRQCQNSLGDPIIYDLCVTMESSLSTSPSKPTEHVVLLSHTPAKQKQAVATHAAPTKTSQPSKAKQRRINSNISRQRSSANEPATVKKQSRAQAQKTSEILLTQSQTKRQTSAFQQMQKIRNKLPAAAENARILQSLRSNQVLLIAGQTGCGKTTQVPQFILDDFISSGNGGECNIVCTQPRRIAAIGVATRVAQERCEELGDIVGYQIRMDSKCSSKTRLLFCTTGVLLRRLLSDRSLANVSHVIVDEVHERNVDTDFLLAVLRDVLPERPTLRVVLMSATMNSKLFATYFAATKSRAPCPVIEIPGFTYPVNCHYLEDVLRITGYQVPRKRMLKRKKGNAGNDDDNDEDLSTLLSPEEIARRVDDTTIDYALCALLIKHLVEANGLNKPHGAILVFLPGIAEIRRLRDHLLKDTVLAPRLWILPLHGSLSAADQALVFRSPTAGQTKIILSTNIAETSITIDDITVVIDAGKVKEMRYDAIQRRSQLLECWTSQAAGDQRKGRAGRVQAGSCFRLFSTNRFASMERQASAEIHRVSLESLCLQILQLELGPIRSFLHKAIEPPSERAIESAMDELLSIAALERVEKSPSGTNRRQHRGSADKNDEDEIQLTPLGRHLAMLPLDARMGKLLIYGAILGCVSPVASIAACMSSRSPFVTSLNDPEVQKSQEQIKQELGATSQSDHLLLARIVERYMQVPRGQKFRRQFCRDHGLNFDTIETIVELRSDFLQHLSSIGFAMELDGDANNSNDAQPRVIKAALCAGLYNHVIHVVYPEQKYFQAAHGVITEAHDAKRIRYYVQSRNQPHKEQNETATDNQRVPQERVFLHPSSCNFTQSQYDSPWLVYSELVETSKVFAREITMVPPYALLLFGGRLDVRHEKNQLWVDDWIRFSAVARIGVLVKAMRREVDLLLTEKLARPELRIAESPVAAEITQLLISEGM